MALGGAGKKFNGQTSFAVFFVVFGGGGSGRKGDSRDC